MSAAGSVASTERYRFGAFELQPDKRRLLQDGATISLRPRAFDLLGALVDRAGHLVTKDELLDQVWPKMVVEEAALHVQVSALRKILGADAITTVSGRGYQFTLPVTRGDAEATRASKPKHNLPYQLTSFIGREQEIAQLEELVTTHRLVTLTGAGGAGKTRLAIEVASRLIDAFPDGVWLVELAALSDPRLVPKAVAQALALTDQPARPVMETLSDFLGSKKPLLVLDNVEHLLEACVHLVNEIVRRSPDVAVLVTSRERLGMAGELTYRVPSLTVPGSNEALMLETVSPYEGVRLFVERAKLARSDFDLTAENAASVASICARLDGMPLAIELTAARLRSMSVDELSEHLDQRFALRTDGSRAALPRHSTLRSMLDWSYDLLTEREQTMLRRVAVFAGGWTLASAEQVCAGDGIDASGVLEQLTSLVDKSLVVTDEQAGATRYRMLGTVRQYAQDRLRESGEQAQWRVSHLAGFVALAEEFNEGIAGPKQQVWLSRIASEHDNLRAALAWSAESSPLEGLRLANALIGFWRVLGHLVEGREWLARLLDAVPIDGSTRERARGLRAAGYLATPQGDFAAAERLLQESLALYREIDDPNGAGRALNGLAYLSLCQGHYPEAETLAREAIDRARATGDRRLVYASLSCLAVALHGQGQWTAARELYEQALEVARELGTPFEMGHALNEIGRAECDEGRHDLARKHSAEGMTILHRLGNRPGVIDSLEGLAGVAAATGAPQRAARLWGAADVLRQEIGNVRSVHESIAYERKVKAVRAILTREAFDQAWDEGRAMSLDDAVRYALDEQAGRDN
jgi:predicted ATPase/DNA-binding winged helix-turn-helix (wHTH) protein